MIQGGIDRCLGPMACTPKDCGRLEANPMPVVAEAQEDDIGLVTQCDALVEVLNNEARADLPDEVGRVAIESYVLDG